MNLTARFKKIADNLYFIVEHTKSDFSGVYTTRRIVAFKPEIDFAIDNYVEFHHHYNLIVQERNSNVLDDGESITIINIPKSMITIANRHLK